MGICNAPATFQRAMNVTFQNFVNKTRLTQGMINFCIIVYMDDILVYSETCHGHAQHIEWTLGALRDAGFRIALEKSEFFLSEISFLGYVVTRGGMRSDSRKVAAVKDVPGTGVVLGEHMPAPRGDISAIKQLHHPRISPDLLRFAQFFNTTGVYVAAEFRFAAHSRALVLAEALAYRRLLAPGISHVSTMVVFSGDISTVDPARHTAIRTSLREWGEQLAQWRMWCEHYLALSLCLTEVELTWTRDSEHRAARESVELLIIQTWRTEVEGDLRGFVFGAVEPGHRQTIVWELTIPFAQLVDDLPLDIISQCDESRVPHILSRRLTPYLQWSACLEDRTRGGSYPSRVEYLNPQGIIDVLFFQTRTTVEEEAEVEDESEEETSEEEGSYSEYNEEESRAESEEEEEDQLEEEEGFEWETLGEEADRAEAQEEDPEAAARRRGDRDQEAAAGVHEWCGSANPERPDQGSRAAQERRWGPYCRDFERTGAEATEPIPLPLPQSPSSNTC
ncbi:hypothetical protein CBR_g6293 [Chara braunii]|uniref:Reverse transcriptase domain-containing protein n=1 Tax=Chara braunii TaxID=69332 RepID=A0A388KJD4_CHABU|nr:hypothetical protein CBR_g6293 [Chara braunii]|eukprot:GBG70162.1 hypothetical protein CBR_g6293 [Chara braunii]